MNGFNRLSTKGDDIDIEAGTLYPGLSYGENQLRWGFIRKVYGIVAAQLVLTTIVSFVTVLYSPINDLLRGNSGLLLFFLFLPLVCEAPTPLDLVTFSVCRYCNWVILGGFV